MTLTKKCETCDAILEQRLGQTKRSFGNWRFCAACLKVRLKGQMRSKAEKQPCKSCGEMFGPNHGESYMRWRQRKYCAKNCGVQSKQCRFCGKEMLPSPQHNHARWSEISFCSTECRKANRCTICQRFSKVTPCNICKVHNDSLEMEVYEPTQEEIWAMCEEFRKLRPREPIGGVPIADTQWVRTDWTARRMVKMIGNK